MCVCDLFLYFATKGYAAREFVAQGVASGDVCIVGEEPVLPYERPALSKAVLMKENVRLPGFHTCVGGGGERQTEDWYKQHGITTMLGEKVIDVDVKMKTLKTESDKTIVAEKALILGTGASPIYLSRTPGNDLNGVLYLRDNDQALKLYDALQANIGKWIIIVGGGYIGMEVAAAAVTVGCKVKMVFPEENVMPRLFTPQIAAYYEALYKSKGVEFLNNGRLCKAFLDDGTGNVRGIKMCKGDEELEVEGSLVVVGVGARANTSLFTDKLKMDARGGVIVDATLKTSADGVYAMGDIASFPLKMYGDRMCRMEHVVNARLSAAHAVKAALGSTEPYDYLPYFYSRVFHLSWQFFGDNEGECVVVGDFAPKLVAIWHTNGRVNGVFMESPTADDTESLKKIARTQPSVDVDAFKAASSADSALAMLV